MQTNYDVSRKKIEVRNYIERKYQLETATLSNLDLFLDQSISGIIALKIWKTKLESESETEANIYLDEIISNLNQVVILSPLGFTIPSAFLIRRSYENLIAYLFYKDHSIEFFTKEKQNSAKYKKSEEFETYLKDFPLQKYYSTIDFEQSKRILSELIIDKGEQYSELSKYVHGHSERYLELISILNEITPDNDALNILRKFICEFNTFSNTLLILFFFNSYRSFTSVEKRIIRLSIHGGNKRYKERIRRLFGEN